MSEELLQERYKLKELIGEGGAAYVYLGHDLRSQQRIAIKQLKQPLHALSEGDILRQRFLREARLQSILNHPNIVQVHEILEMERDIFIIMEYVEGQSLKKFLKPYQQQGGAPVPLVLDLFEQLLKGLAFAHENGVIHRDIKPSNLMIRPDHILKIADFGIARGVEDPQLTQTGLLLGTPLYMSPEQCRGDKEIGPSTDLYSAGIALFEALTGRTPFEVTNPSLSHYQLIQQHLFDIPPSPRTLRATLPRGLDGVLAKALAKHPDERFPDADAFAKALRESVSSQVVVSPRPEKDDNVNQREDHLPDGAQTIPDDPLQQLRIQQEVARRRPSTQAHSREQVPVRRQETQPMGESDAFAPPAHRPGHAKTVATPPSSELLAYQATEAMPVSFQEMLEDVKKDPPKTTPPVPSNRRPTPETTQSKRKRPKPTLSEQTRLDEQQGNQPWKWMTLAVVVLLFVGGGLIWKLQSASNATNTDAGTAKPDHFFALSKKVWRPTRVKVQKRKKSGQLRERPPVRPRPSVPQGMVQIGAGWFLQGQGKPHHKSLSYRIGENNQLQWMKNDHPQRRVYLPSFWIDKREVRAGEYEICVQAGHCKPIMMSRRYFNPRPRKRKVSVSSTLAAELPMVFVSYKHARQYCQWLKKRLPTEAEWEKAARGSHGRLYPWGQQAPTCANASIKSCDSTQKGTQASSVLRGKTPLGIFDLAGNVWEWTADCYMTKGYQTTTSHNPVVRKKRCNRGVVRGGSYLLPASSPGLRAYYRRPLKRWKRLQDIGFRCARSASL